jgi:WD40 repeat protein
MSALVVLSSVAVGSGMWAWSAGRLDRARRNVEQSRTEVARRAIEARHYRYAADIRQAHQLALNGQGPKVLELLRKYRPAPGEDDIREFAWYYVMRLCHGERRSLRGHERAVYHAAFSPDGRTFVSCGQDGTVRLWDVATGRTIRMLRAPGRADEVNWAEFSPDGRTIVSAGDDGQARLWDVATASLRATIAAHEGEAYARFTPDGRRLISAGRRDGRIKLWDLATHELRKAIKASEDLVENIAFSPDGKTLATTGGDGSVRLWNLADLSALRGFLVRGEGAVYSLAFSADGTRLATGDGFGLLRLWNPSSGELQAGFPGVQHTRDIQAVSFLAGDRMIVSGGDSGDLKLWDAAAGQFLGSLLGHTQKVWSISVSPDGSTLATASSDGTVKHWDARPARPERALPPLTDREYGTMDFAFAPDGQTAIVARAIGREWFSATHGRLGYLVGADLEVMGFDAITGATRFHRVLATKVRAYRPHIRSEGALVFLNSPENESTVWEVATGKRLNTIGQFEWLPEARDRGLIVKRRMGGQIELVDDATGEARLVLKGGESWNCVASSPNGKLAALRRAAELAIWDLSTNQVVRERHGKQADLTAAAFSPDGTVLAFGYGNGNIELWDVDTLEFRGSLPGHSQCINDLAFSHGGKTLISVSGDATARLWDVVTCEDLLVLSAPNGAAFDRIRHSPDGRTVGFCAFDGEQSWLYLLPTALPAEVESEENP